VSVAIITYHALGDFSSPLFVSAPTFESHLDALVKSGRHTVTLGAVANCLQNGEPLPENAVVLTFDDGYESVYTSAWPRLKERGFIATLFLISDYCGRNNRWPGQPPSVPVCSLMTWEHAAEMAHSGCELGAHTRTHPALPTLSLSQLEDEIVGSQEAVQTNIGQAVRVFAAPYGVTTPTAENIVRKNFDGAVSTQLGTANLQSNPYRMERVDAHYLTPNFVRKLDSPLFQPYLRLRQALREVRRTFRPDWHSVPSRAGH
jgi:peptidoglycan/xylan/chitin deacetylase (PgdA/CDA1 family)